MKTSHADAQPPLASPARIGVLVCNIGSPAAPTPRALRPYLAQFLGDRRIVELPRWLWLPVLYGIILPVRSRHSARLYARIWTEQGSPLTTMLDRQATQLHERIQKRAGLDIPVVAAVRYGQPSIARGLRQLRDSGIQRVLVFPLYPQYSATTTATVFDAVFDELKRWRWMPELRTIQHYYDFPGYITALARTIRETWAERGRPDRLLFSFHGIPRSYVLKGDPYYCECQETARLLSEQLELDSGVAATAFQSRLGPSEWLPPYTDATLAAWGADRLKNVHVICPGFSADCLETLDEVANEGREAYAHAGGLGFHYIPALNDRSDHLDALTDIAIQHLQGWLDTTMAL